jgi:GT2 family glycosyltransferase
VSDPSSPTYAVIIVTYQRDAELRRTLEAVERQTVGRRAMEICVIDNGGAEAVRPDWESRVDAWVEPGENLGCSGGRNEGVRHTSAPILVFVDDDGIPEDDFVESLGDVLDRHADVVAVRGKAVALDHPILTTMAAHYDRGPDEREDLLTLEGAAAIRRDAWEACGGYDVSRAFHEGLELSQRLLATRPEARMMYTPHAVLRHDFFKGLGHFLQKARMMAAATNRVKEEADPALEAVIVRARGFRRFDGRSRWARVVGAVLGKVYNWTIAVYRWRLTRHARRGAP